jgi:phosphatidate cytidylyltransferase
VTCAAGIAVFWAVGLLFLPPAGLFAVLLVCSILCQWEFYRLAGLGGQPACGPVGLTLGAVWLAAVFAFPVGGPAGPLMGDRWESLLLAGGGALILVRLLFDPRSERPLESAAITLLGLFYVPFLLSYYIRLAQWGTTQSFQLGKEGILLAVYASVVVKLSDIGGYLAGMSFGRHKMFPRISPAKTWEGLAGGLALSVAGSIGLVALFHSCSSLPATPLNRLNLWGAAGLGLLLGGVGVLGDLIESMLKRAAHLKDSSGILPGMGGLLDVFDSLLFAPAVLYFLLPLL